MQTEIVVPVSMTPLQRQICERPRPVSTNALAWLTPPFLDRGILERNASAIESIFQKAGGTANGYKAKARKTNL